MTVRKPASRQPPLSCYSATEYVTMLMPCHLCGWIERTPGGPGKLTVWKPDCGGAAAARIAWSLACRPQELEEKNKKLDKLRRKLKAAQAEIGDLHGE